MASRDSRAATYAPPTPRIYQPDPNYPSFQDSRKFEEFEEGRKEIEAQGTTGWSAGGRWGGPTRIDTTAASVEKLRKDKQTEYDDQVRQAKSFDESKYSFEGTHVGTFNPDTDTPEEFVSRDKSQYVQDFLIQQQSAPAKFQASPEEAETIYYQQLLQKNGISSASFPGSMPWNQKINRYHDQAMNMLSPVVIAGQETNITGYQKRALQESSGPRRARAFAGVVANPMNEEFIPIATSQALFSMPGAAIGNETLEKAGATAGEWVGFGFGIGKVGRSVRWMTEDITIPFKIIRGSSKLIKKKFGTQDFRKPAQLSYVIDNAGQAPPSAALDADERRIAANFTPEENLAYAARDAGGTPPPSGSRVWVQHEYDIRVKGKHGTSTERTSSWQRYDPVIHGTTTGEAAAQVAPKVARLIVVHEGELTKTYQITNTDSYFRAAGEILNLSPEQIQQASDISRPIIKSLAESFGIDEATYIQGLVPVVRGTEDIGQPFAGRVLAGGEEAQMLGDSLMDTVFRRSASLVEFIKTSPDLTNDADSFITVQHELAHIVLQDIFRLVTNGQGGQTGSINKLSESLKTQVLVRAELTGEVLTPAQRQAIDELTTEDIAALMADSSHWQPNSKMAALRNSTDQNRKLIARDLQMLLHEAGADLFAKYTLDVARGKRSSSATREAMGVFDDTVTWQAAAQSLSGAWKLLKQTISAPHGIATARNTHDQKVIDAFSSVIDEIGAGKIYVDKKIDLPTARQLSFAFAKQRNSETAAIARMSDFLLGEKRTLLSDHRSEIIADLVDSDVPHFFDGTNARWTRTGKDIFEHPSYENIWKEIASGELDATPYDLRGTDELRRALTDVLSNPDTKLAPIYDVRPEVRARLEVVGETPEIRARLSASAWKNEAGEPIVFFTGAAEDYAKFDHLKSNHLFGLVGHGLYNSDWDVVGGSYAALRFLERAEELAKSTTSARVQAYHSLVPEDKVLTIEGFGMSDPVAKRFYDNVFADDRYIELQRKLQAGETGLVTGSVNAEAQEAINLIPKETFTYGQVKEIHEAWRKSVLALTSSNTTFRGVENTFGVNTSRNIYKNFIAEFQHEVQQYRAKPDAGMIPERRAQKNKIFKLVGDEFSEVDDPYFYPKQPEEYTFAENFADLLRYESDPTDPEWQKITTIASIRAVRKTVLEEIEASKKLGVFQRQSPATQKAQTDALARLTLQEKVVATQEQLHQIRDLDEDVAGMLDSLSPVGFYESSFELIVKVGNQHIYEVMKSASLNKVGQRQPLEGGIHLKSVEPDTDVLDGASYILQSMRNRQIHEGVLRSVRESMFRDSGGSIQVSEASAVKYINLLNDLYVDSDVHQITEVGGAIMGGVPHRVTVFTGPNELIEKNRVFVRLNGTKNTPDQAAAWKKRNPKAANIDDTVTTGELGLERTRYGNEVKSGFDRFNENLKKIQEKLEETNSAKAVENPVQASDEILKTQAQAEAGLTVPTQNLDGKNIVPSGFKYEHYFGPGIRKPINKELLDSILTDTTGEFRSVTGEITPEGQRVLAESASEKISEMLGSKDYREFLRAREDLIGEGKTRGAAIQHRAAEGEQAGKLSPIERQKEIETGRALSKAEKSGFKPIEIHPIEIQALLDHGERRLRELNVGVYSRADFLDAVEELLGVTSPRVGSAAQARIAKQAPALAGLRGTIATQKAAGLTPAKLDLLENALGIKEVLRDENPLSRAQIIRGLILTLFNIPRQTLLGIDYGAVMNQGGLFIGRFTRRGGYVDLGKSLKGTLTDGHYQAQMDQIKQDPDYDYLTKNTNIFISDLNGPLSRREEGVMFNIFRLAGKDSLDQFPKPLQAIGKALASNYNPLKYPSKVVAYPFKHGERFHNLYLNKMRYSMLRDFNAKLVKSGVPDVARKNMVGNYADFLNKATGRGSLGTMENLAPELATFLLAPRWMVSRVQAPVSALSIIGKEGIEGFRRFPDTKKGKKAAKAYAAKTGKEVKQVDGSYRVVGKGGYVSKQIAEELTRSFGVLAGILGLLAINGFRPQLDWRKSGYGKVANDGHNFISGEEGSGKINVDLTMGLGSVWRFIARGAYGLATEKEISAGGVEYEADVMRQLTNFLRSKLSPLGASLTGAISGTNYFGEEVTGEEMFIPGQSTNMEDIAPLMIQQVLEASRELDGGTTLAILGASAAIGTNVNVYPDKNDLAREMQGVDYEDLYPYEQKYINRVFYEGSKFQPSEYIQDFYELELEQYEEIEKIMGGPLEMGEKASRIYRYMDETDIKLQGLRMGFFKDDKDRQPDEPETDRLKKAQNDYYSMLNEVYEEGRYKYSDEEIQEKKTRFLSSLTPKQRDYIDANKTNFMVPDSIFTLIKPDGRGTIKAASSNAQRRKWYALMGREIPKEWDLDDPLDLADKYYAVAKNAIYSNEARKRLSQGRTPIPTAPEQIEITRGLLERAQ